MGRPEETIDPAVLAEVLAEVDALPALNDAQLDALADALTLVRLRATS